MSGHDSGHAWFKQQHVICHWSRDAQWIIWLHTWPGHGAKCQDLWGIDHLMGLLICHKLAVTERQWLIVLVTTLEIWGPPDPVSDVDHYNISPYCIHLISLHVGILLVRYLSITQYLTKLSNDSPVNGEASPCTHVAVTLWYWYTCFYHVIADTLAPITW